MPRTKIYHEMFDPPYYNGARENVSTRITILLAKAIRAKSVCDLGCGKTHDLMVLTELGLIEFGYGVDIDECNEGLIKNIKIPNELKEKIVLENGDYKLAHSYKPEIPFDLTIANHIIEHVNDPEHFLKIATEISPVLLITLPYEKCHDDPKYHKNHWNLKEITNFCTRVIGDKYSIDSGMLKWERGNEATSMWVIIYNNRWLEPLSFSVVRGLI